MARTIRGCLTAWSQPERTGEPEITPSFPQQEEESGAINGEVVADYKSDVDYEPEGSDPEIKPVNHIQEKEDPEAEYAKMEIPCQGTVHQRSMSCKVAEAFEHIHPT